jgi:carbon storage regulator
MLVLSRRERERIRLGDSIVVTVVRLSGDRVRLGIEAPADVLVLRDELDADGSVIAEQQPDASRPIRAAG